MPISGSSSRSRATRCSALRPRRPNASRSPRTSWTDLSGRTRPSALPLAEMSTSPVWQGRSRAASRSKVPERTAPRLRQRTGQAPPSRSSRVDGQLRAVLLRGQADRRGLTRSGRSLLTRTTLSPSAARLRATDRMRESLSPSRNPAGSTVGSEWLSSTRTVPPGRRPVAQRPAYRTRCAGRRASAGLPGEVAQFRMVPLGFQLRDDDDRQDYLVLVKTRDRHRVGEQDTGIEDVRTATLGITTQTPLGAETGPAPRQARTCRMDRAWPPKGPRRPSVSSPARNARSTKIRGPPREGRRTIHHYRGVPRPESSKSTTT